MMISALAITSLFAFAISYNSDAADRAVALAVAQRRMERLSTVGYTDAALVTGATTDTVTSAGRQYSVTTTIGGSATLKTINIQVTPLAATKSWATGPVTVMSLRAAPYPGLYMK